MAEKGASKANQRQSNRHKPKYQAYVTRSTCLTCRVIFKSPKKRFAHVQSDHKSMVGKSTRLHYKGFESAFKEI